MYLDLFSEETPCGSIVNCKGPPPVSDHSVFAFWVVAKSLTGEVRQYQTVLGYYSNLFLS